MASELAEALERARVTARIAAVALERAAMELDQADGAQHTAGDSGCDCSCHDHDVKPAVDHRRRQESMAAELRAAGWWCIPPEHVHESVMRVLDRSAGP